MDKNKELKKISAALIIILFIILAFAPSLDASVSKTSAKQTDLVDITIQIFGLESVREHNVQLTKEEEGILKNLIDNLENRLDNAQNRQERIAIFKETIISLDELGLIPEDVSVEELQKLVTTIPSKSPTASSKILNRFISLNTNNLYDWEEDTNTYCLIAGNTDVTRFFNSKIGSTAQISFGITTAVAYSHIYEADGWITTDGKNGLKKFTNGFLGGIKTIHGKHYYHGGTSGFKGISITWDYFDYWETFTAFFLGNARQVTLGKWTLENQQNIQRAKIPITPLKFFPTIERLLDCHLFFRLLNYQ